MIATATGDQPSTAAPFAAVFAALYAAHLIGDHWVQTDHQAAHKALPGWPGRLACLRHVASYTVTALIALLAVAWSTDLHLHPVTLTAGLTVSAVTHYIADRRTPLHRLARSLDPFTGKANFLAFGQPRPGRDDNPCLGTGAYSLDQSWHIASLLVAALVIA